MEVSHQFPARGRPVSGKQTRGCGAVRSGGNLVEERAAETRGVGANHPFLSPMTRAGRRQCQLAGRRRERGRF